MQGCLVIGDGAQPSQLLLPGSDTLPLCLDVAAAGQLYQTAGPASTVSIPPYGTLTLREGSRLIAGDMFSHTLWVQQHAQLVLPVDTPLCTPPVFGGPRCSLLRAW